ncbi:hypothetical protein BJ912DRAFT_1056429 [Pholiota molesta]|nr:hypothetical protein BJ912DRAFT_1056429 [Pholiota molesta]
MTEQSKSTAPTQEHPYPQPTLVPFPPQGYNGGPYPPPGPPGAFMPPFYAYPPPPDGSHPEGAPNGGVPPHFMIGLPPGVPGVLYAYPPPQTQQFGAPPANPAPSALSRPKRKQVKMACTNCAGACKRCDENRPCERCVKYGIADTCIDGQRKERKKGIKRGPYRRKNKNESDSNSFNGEWTPPSSSTTAAAIHAVAQYAPPEGSYYPGHPNSSNSTPNPNTNPDGSPSAHSNNGQPMMPYYIHPGGYPPFPHYPPTMYPGPPPPGAPHSQPQAAPPVQPTAPQMAAPEQQPPQTVNPAEASGKPDDAPPSSGSANGVAAVESGANVNGTGKKRPRTGKNGEPRTKKTKVTAAPMAVAAEKGKDGLEGQENGAAPVGEEVSANGEAEAEKSV